MLTSAKTHVSLMLHSINAIQNSLSTDGPKIKVNDLIYAIRDVLYDEGEFVCETNTCEDMTAYLPIIVPDGQGKYVDYTDLHAVYIPLVGRVGVRYFYDKICSIYHDSSFVDWASGKTFGKHTTYTELSQMTQLGEVILSEYEPLVSRICGHDGWRFSLHDLAEQFDRQYSVFSSYIGEAICLCSIQRALEVLESYQIDGYQYRCNSNIPDLDDLIKEMIHYANRTRTRDYGELCQFSDISYSLCSNPDSLRNMQFHKARLIKAAIAKSKC